jgi:2-oxoglutarate ferredoxin oxidoreductase subunit alpha
MAKAKKQEIKMVKADPKGVLTGAHYLDGDHACCEGALAAGCRFVAGYPITPSTEVVERFASRIPQVGGMFIQMEDEIASSIAIQGAVWAGKKAMTVTSGPGISLMMEHVGLAVMLETPCVFVNVQRGGPSTGLPTLPGQADMMQARWGSHGDYEIIAISPNSPQECFDLMIDAFNLSERFRVPVFFMMDECVGHMTEKVIIPKADEVEVLPRRYTDKPPGEYLPYEPDEDLVPPMVKAGQGYRFHVTGLTHDEKGYPVMSAECQEKCVHRLLDKIRVNTDKIYKNIEWELEGAEVMVLSYGISSRVSLRGMRLAREKGVKTGMFRPVVVWPFPERRLKELAEKVKAVVVVEMNYGQIYYEVDRLVGSKTKVVLLPHGGGTVHDPKVICDAIVEAAK